MCRINQFSSYINHKEVMSQKNKAQIQELSPAGINMCPWLLDCNYIYQNTSNLHLFFSFSTLSACFYTSAPAIAVAGHIMFSGCPSVCPSLVNAISQERLKGISSNLPQPFAWTQG